MDKVKVLISGETNFMLEALAYLKESMADRNVTSTLHNTEEDENDEWTEFAEYVLEGSRDEINAVLDLLEMCANVTENEEAFGGELGEVE